MQIFQNFCFFKQMLEISILDLFVLIVTFKVNNIV